MLSGGIGKDDGPHRAGSGIEHHGTYPPAPAGAFEPGGNDRGTDLPRFGRAFDESDRGFHRKWFVRAADFEAPASSADHRFFAQSRDAPASHAALGCAAAKNDDATGYRRYGKNRGAPPARGGP